MHSLETVIWSLVFLLPKILNGFAFQTFYFDFLLVDSVKTSSGTLLVSESITYV
jgi:hypothetical protein